MANKKPDLHHVIALQEQALRAEHELRVYIRMVLELDEHPHHLKEAGDLAWRVWCMANSHDNWRIQLEKDLNDAIELG